MPDEETAISNLTLINLKLYQNEKDINKKEALLNEILKYAPNESQTKKLLARLKLEQSEQASNPEEKKKLLEEALKLNPSLAE